MNNTLIDNNHIHWLTKCIADNNFQIVVIFNYDTIISDLFLSNINTIVYSICNKPPVSPARGTPPASHEMGTPPTDILNDRHKILVGNNIEELLHANNLLEPDNIIYYCYYTNFKINTISNSLINIIINKINKLNKIIIYNKILQISQINSYIM